MATSSRHGLHPVECPPFPLLPWAAGLSDVATDSLSCSMTVSGAAHADAWMDIISPSTVCRSKFTIWEEIFLLKPVTPPRFSSWGWPFSFSRWMIPYLMRVLSLPSSSRMLTLISFPSRSLMNAVVQPRVTSVIGSLVFSFKLLNRLLYWWHEYRFSSVHLTKQKQININKEKNKN